MTAAENFIDRSRYWLTKEYPIKIRHCVSALPRAVVWARPIHLLPESRCARPLL